MNIQQETLTFGLRVCRSRFGDLIRPFCCRSLGGVCVCEGSKVKENNECSRNNKKNICCEFQVSLESSEINCSRCVTYREVKG